MTRKISSLIIFCFFCLVLDIKKVDAKRAFPSTVQPRRYYKEQLNGRTKPPVYSEELKSVPAYDSRTPATSKPHCSTNCNKSKRLRKKQVPLATAKPAPLEYKALKLSALARNDTAVKFPKTKKLKYSRKYDPAAISEDSGFRPVLGPYGVRTTPRTAQRRTRHKINEDLIVKESRASPNMLGNGNFEILRGGLFPEDDSNELVEARRMERGYDSYALPRFQRIPFNVQNFQFPSFYQDRQQIPPHPMFFPRAGF